MKRIMLLLVSVSLLFLPGCWDRSSLRDARLIYGVGFDQAPHGKVKATIVIRNMPSEDRKTPSNEIHSVIGNTARETRDLLDSNISEKLETYKVRALLFGKEIAKKGIFPHLDVFYRDPRASLNSRIAIVDGEASQVFYLRRVGETLIAEHVDELLESEEDAGVLPRTNVQSICPLIMEPGQDFLLPLLRKTGNGEVTAVGTALFHGDKWTGELNRRESVLYLMLINEIKKKAQLTIKIHPQHGENPLSYITIDMLKPRLKREVKTSPSGGIDVFYSGTIYAKVAEFPEDRLADSGRLEQLNRELSRAMSLEVKRVLDKIQRANCDALSIGRHLAAFYPEFWKKQDWEKDYAKVRFHPQLKVKILETGIIY
ncbi:Ger(x)C family spore germination protein [Laceyella tengchongensis]